MKRSKFSPTQIAKILKVYELGKDVGLYHESMELAEPPFINGAIAMEAWKPLPLSTI